MTRSPSGRYASFGAAVLFLVPVLHPLLIPVVGVPSHLLWWVHVLPVAFLTFQYGRNAAVGTLLLSGALVASGEAFFGQGYGQAAPTETILALTVALTATNVLVVFFALYARGVSGRYRLLFDEVRVGVIRLGQEGRILRTNQAAAEVLGWDDPDGLVGTKLDDVLRIGEIPDIDALVERGGWTAQVELLTPSGPRTIHGVLVAARDPDGDGSQILVADRSVEVLQEQELQRQAKLASLGEALAGVAHELNNPLASILAQAELGAMDAEEDPEEVRSSFEVIRSQAVRIRDLVRELLGFSRTREEATCVPLHETLARIARVQRITLGRDVSLTEDIRWRGDVEASETKIEQIVLNLISNAAYAIREDGGRGTITLSVRKAGQHAKLEVRDDGPGIAPEVLDNIFDPFITTKPEGEGTGLGLAISRRLARAWGGDLTARNVEPRGAAFTLVLPLPNDGDGAPTRAESERGHSEAGPPPSHPTAAESDASVARS